MPFFAFADRLACRFPRAPAVILAAAMAYLPAAEPLAAQIGTTPATALKIVVIAGEDAVNIIQQKTAVAPVVEIRDRNDLPVSGAAVTFTIAGNNATFAGGVQTLTVTTNAAGRAVVSALNPLGGGAFQINVQAAFQGQTAVATIAQTNVMTAAQAAAASGGGASTGAGGTAGGAAGGATGGGLSATTLGVVGAAAAGGAVAASKLLRDEGTGAGPPSVRYSGPYSGQGVRVFANCTQNLANSGTVSVDLQVADNGTVTGTGQVNGTVTVVAVSTGCIGVGGPQLNQVDMHGCCVPQPPVSGTTGSLTFRGSHPGNLGTIWTYNFSGVLSDPDIIGTFTLTISEGSQLTLPPVPVRLVKGAQ